jgi:hypothetical protein
MGPFSAWATYLKVWAVSSAIVFLILLAVGWGYLTEHGSGSIFGLVFLSLIFGNIPPALAVRWRILQRP